MKIIKQMLVVALSFLLVSCMSSAGGILATKTPTTIPTPADTPIPINDLPNGNQTGEILKISGNGPDSSNTFTLDTETMAMVKWEQHSTGEFKLYILNLDPAQSGTPYGKVLFEMVLGPSSGFSDFSFAAGKYQVDVDQSDGPWEIWITSVTH